MATETQQTTSSTQSTEPRTQSTQQASQHENVIDTSCWGSLIPFNAKLTEYKFDKSIPRYRIGRGQDVEISLPGKMISAKHCTIEWDGDENSTSTSVKVTDHSRNGTFINGRQMVPNSSYILRDGNEIAFGTHKPKESDGSDDYRFIYRHTPSSKPAEGVHKDYDMLHALGNGAFATVMKALNKAEGRWYAVKIIHIHKFKLKLREGWEKRVVDGMPTDLNARKLVREIKILEQLKHKNVCQFKEVFLERDTIYLVLEYLQGGDLSKYLLAKERQKRLLSEAQTAHIIFQMCDALAYIHSLNIAHRDMKPENVLLTTDYPPVVKVADFGLAKAKDTFTELQSVCGTDTYLAPEVRNHGPEGYSLVVDSWSIGVIAHVMLIRFCRAFVEDDVETGLETQIAGIEVDWARLRSRGIGEQCEQFLRGLLEHDPERRTTMDDACRDPWLVEQAGRVHDVTTEDPLDSPLASSPAPQAALDARSTSHDAAPYAKAQSATSVCRGSTRANTVEAEQPRSATRLARTETAVTGFGDEDDGLTERARAYKRKVQDRSDASLIPRAESQSSRDLGTETTVAEPRKAPRGGKSGGKPRAPGIKRVRTGGTDTASAGDDSDEVPGLTRVRRSPRLNPPPP